MTFQPVPKVDESDVKRVVSRDFPNDQQDQALQILSRYGASQWHGDKWRVQLAAMKLANGNLASLESQITIACQDFRDVLSQAEYPEYSKQDFSKQLHSEDKSRIFESDWNQYEAWLKQ